MLIHVPYFVTMAHLSDLQEPLHLEIGHIGFPRPDFGKWAYVPRRRFNNGHYLLIGFSFVARVARDSGHLCWASQNLFSKSESNRKKHHSELNVQKETKRIRANVGL